MKRRELLVLLAAALAGPVARAQQPGRRYRVGILLPVDTAAASHLPVIRERLAARGFIEGRNLEIDVRYARTNPDGAQELLAKKPDAILAATDDAVRAAQTATKSTPIVFAWVADPVLSGFVQAYGRPGGNTTGVTNRYYELTAKRLELLHELLPGAQRVAMTGTLARWRRASLDSPSSADYPRSTRFRRRSTPAGSRPMESTSSISIGAQRTMWIGSCARQSRRTCLWNCRGSSNWLAT